ncbi:MAG: HD domain-containing protein, partial [Candidatus Aminicenantes bacterium]|nr:HD domain-containing protein [Candidatus Aminicenantes bacterium]
MINLAIEVAAKAHKGHVRKYTDIPYISHPFGVAIILSRCGCSDELIAAGLLHDVVEDTSISLGDISQMFGDEVTTIVYGCTEQDKSQPWMVRKS